MAKNFDAIHIWGGEESAVWIARKSTSPTIPEGLADPSDPFKDGGWLSEDGITLNIAPEVTKHRAFQGSTLVKVKVGNTERTSTLQFLQEDPMTTELFYGHDGVTDASTAGDGSIARYDLPQSIKGTEYVILVDFFDDAGLRKRLVVETAIAGERGEISNTAEDMPAMEITFDFIGAAYVLTDDPVFTAELDGGAGVASTGGDAEPLMVGAADNPDYSF
ncbi:MAG: hypothetical protein ACTHXG_14430 [Micrococcaceae bacterium]